jgi:hypothetical protein
MISSQGSYPLPSSSASHEKDLINSFHNYSGRASSIAIILFGSILYTWVKHQESQPAAAPSRKGSYERVRKDDIEAGEKDATK